MHLRAFAPGTSPRHWSSEKEGYANHVLRFFSERSDRSRNKHGDSKMLNQDLVSDGFLALTAAGIFLLWSSLIAYAFA